jgi:glycosyltransferase involved in cell wall biosynthesis
LEPLVSIITPCYRQSRFLRQAIESVLAQSYKNVELVIVNDGSDDDTEAIGRSFGEQIRYHWQPNRGLPAARNAAIALSTGKYILCLDADDRLTSDAIGRLVNASQNRDDVLCVMGFRAFQHDDEAGIAHQWVPPANLGLESAALMWRNFGPPHIYLCSRAMLTGIGGFDTHLNSCEDWDVWQRLVLAGADIVAVPQIGALYRLHPDSMSTNVLRMATSQAKVLRRSLRRIAADPRRIIEMGGNPHELSRAIRSHLARENFDTGYLLRNHGEYFGAFRHYCQSMSAAANTRAFTGILKLLPHRLHRALSAPIGARSPTDCG